ncbi:MAG: S46 family peptidase [Alphaproteobacteria bacterium]|nr:S46 family peptidase [Alphaproteobacteria bacterium]
MTGSKLLLAGVLLLAAAASARADEGMWTPNNFPFDKIEKAYGFRPDQAWLDHVRLSSVRLAQGCSAGFVSAQGLVQTNHHCARTCIEQLSTASRNMIELGFYARESKDEIKCPEVEINQLVTITPVTARISKAIAGKDGAAFAKALKAEKAAIEDECVGKDGGAFRCEVVTLYNGGVYDLYKYRRYQDVRLVFAPEQSVAFFGGDPDNFEFPRYNFDVSFLRVYDGDKPLDTARNYLRYAKSDVRPGDLVVSSGHPGSTHRLDTVAQLGFQRDVVLIKDMLWLSELRGELIQFSAQGPEKARVSRDKLFEVENWLKAAKGFFGTLSDPAFMKARNLAEQELRAKVDADPALRVQYGAAWDGIKETLDRFRPQAARFAFVAANNGLDSKLLRQARLIVRHADEARKPDGERLREYTEASFPASRQEVLSTAPIDADLEKLTLAFSLTKMREALGPDDPFVKKALGNKSPAALAAELVGGTRLGDPAFRANLLNADPATIAASSDPMIQFIRRIDPDMRAARREKEELRDAALTRYTTEIAQARFKVEGTSTPPDATFTLRLSYGAVAGYSAAGKQIDPITFTQGLFERATGADPFRLPPSWVAAQSTLNPQQPFNFANSDDIVGGNSGSPVVNKAGELVGLAFDSNIQGLGGRFGYDAQVNRAVAVNVGILREGLAKVYHADRLVDELAK